METKVPFVVSFFFSLAKKKKLKNLWQIKLLSQSLPWLKKTRNGCLLSMPPVKEIMKSWLFMKKIKKRKKHFCKMSYQAFAIFFQGTFIQCLSDPSIRIDLYSQWPIGIAKESETARKKIRKKYIRLWIKCLVFKFYVYYEVKLTGDWWLPSWSSRLFQFRRFAA